MTWFLDRPFLEGLDLRGYDAEAIAARVGLPVAEVRAFVDPGRRYVVRSAPGYGWLVGEDGDGRATLLFFGQPRLSPVMAHPIHAVCFDLERGTIDVHGLDVQLGEGEALDEFVALDAAEEAIGFVEDETATVLAFKHPTLWHYALVPFPFDLHDEAVGEGEGEVDGVRDWIATGSYVLHCGNAYYMGADGSVESS